MNRFDAIVIGAGPAGSSSALGLARAGWSVALVEKSAFPRRKVCGEFVSAAAWRVLDRLAPRVARAERGPAVLRVGLFSPDAYVVPESGEHPLGYAIGRHILDTALCEEAVAAGARLWQPCKAHTLHRERGAWVLRAACHRDDRAVELCAPIVIAAHGSWEPGELPTQSCSSRTTGDALLGFKARFLDAALPHGLMPLVLFPGGYGGLVHTDSGAVSFSFCIRSDVLRKCREVDPGAAGEAGFRHVARHVPALRDVLAGARCEFAWQGAGPIRPGFRPLAKEGLFRVGNAAGEAHPLVAEGICMAIESGALVAHALEACDATPASVRAAQRVYRRSWRATVASRIVAAASFERVTTAAPRLTAKLARNAPALFELAARWSGKGRTAWA